LRRLQGPVTESLPVAFTSIRKFDDRVRDEVAERIDPPSLLQRYNGYRKRDAHEANRLGVEPVAFCLIGMGAGSLAAAQVGSVTRCPLTRARSPCSPQTFPT
jgi:hypothetical protein